MSDATAPFRRRLLRLLAALNRWRKLPAAAVDHVSVLDHVAEAGRTSASYLVLIALSCGIAILGLLLSSPAVVIGAMLISPLMNPIVLVGFALATLDLPMALRGLKAVGLGTALAVLLAAAIVFLSPLDSPTPEILARTTPNLFDLLVAVFSAVAGGYAVAMRKGETIVGVAIATSLMPPLAVVGYGLAVGNWAIFLGAAGLFMTNLLAIALTVNLVAHVFGFGAIHPLRTRLWQTLGIAAAFVVLSIPLGLSLQQIARETVLTARARATLNGYFAPRADHVYGIDIRFPADQPIQVTALVLTENIHRNAEDNVRRALETALRQPVRLSLSQVPVHAHESLDRRAIEALIGQRATKLTEQLHDPAATIAEAASAEAQVPLLDVSVDRAAKIVLLRSAAADYPRLASLRRSQQQLAARFAGWRFVVRVAALPPLVFTGPGEVLTPAQTEALADAAWALKQNGAGAVRATAGWRRAGDKKAARRRAEAVAAVLRSSDIRAVGAAAPHRTASRDVVIETDEAL